MQRQTDATASSYYHQYYEHPTAADPSLFNPISASPHASAPPVMASPSDYSNYPSFPTNPDHVPNPPQYSLTQLHETSQHHHLYHQDQAPVNYDYAFPTNPKPNPNPNPNPNPGLNYDPSYSLNSYSYGFSTLPYDANSFESNMKYGVGDQGMFDGGLYKYNSGQVESAYGGKGSCSSDSGSGGGVMFDDYGRPINVPGGKEQVGSGNSLHNIFKAVPKADDFEDVKSGIQKFRVKMLSEGFDQTDMDVHCQVLDSYIFAFWTKTSVDLEPRRIRLKSSSYTTNNILDMVTASSIQEYVQLVELLKHLQGHTNDFTGEHSYLETSYDLCYSCHLGRVVLLPKDFVWKVMSQLFNHVFQMLQAHRKKFRKSKEIGSSSDPSDLVTRTEQSVEKKKGFIDWKNLIKPVNEEKDHWVPDVAVTKCTACRADFSAFNRKHHCRNCGDVFCDKCTQGRIALTEEVHAQPVRVCDQCMAEVTQRLSNKVAPGRVAGLQSHEDLARKLQEEMDKNCKKGVKFEASGTRMREVACPTCTVHLQVVVPASGSETIECSVCQHPFLVRAH